jgi:hypothetical protein
VLFIALNLNKVVRRIADKKSILLVILWFFLVLHFIQGVAWITTRINDPREVSSEWIVNNIPHNSVVGIESPPIYQFLPNLVTKEYYEEQEYGSTGKNLYKYLVIDEKTRQLPEYVIITNGEIDTNYLISSSKKSLVGLLRKNNYKKLVVFNPNWNFTKYFTGRLDYHLSLMTPGGSISIYKK